MKLEVWDVSNVLTFPNQENPKNSTARPAVIIEDLGDQFEVCPLTKQVHQAGNYSKTISIKKDSPEGIQMGLTFDSILVLDRAIALPKVRLCQKIGECPEVIIEKIEELLGL